MNILHLKYAVEIEKAHSINKAAENLFMGQPNLSRALKELEGTLGITVFERTSAGMVVTPQGEEFLKYAKKILSQIDEVEAMYKYGKQDKQTFSIAVPLASYISYAFSQFANKIDRNTPAEIFYKETNTMHAIDNILHADYNLGIIRYAANYDKYFKSMLEEKNFTYEIIMEFSYILVMSKSHPLAEKEEILFADLQSFTEISHADPYVPSLPFSTVKKEELPDNIDKRIFVFERASQFDLLNSVEGTLMWVSPIPDALLDRYGLIQKKCTENKKIYKDVLIYKNDYHLSKLDNLFIDEVCKAKRQICNS